MRIDNRQARFLGIILIALGIIAVFGLWELVLPATLAVGGWFMYVQRRQMGRTNEGVQFGLWGIGLALLLLVGMIPFFPGILVIVGASLLARGREQKIDQRIQRLTGQLQSGRRSPTTPRVQDVPVRQSYVHAQETEEDASSAGKTIRL